MLRSENTRAHAFFNLFSERIVHIPQLFTVISLVHPYHSTFIIIPNSSTLELYQIASYLQPRRFFSLILTNFLQ